MDKKFQFNSIFGIPKGYKANDQWKRTQRKLWQLGVLVGLSAIIKLVLIFLIPVFQSEYPAVIFMYLQPFLILGLVTYAAWSVRKMVNIPVMMQIMLYAIFFLLAIFRMSMGLVFVILAVYYSARPKELYLIENGMTSSIQLKTTRVKWKVFSFAAVVILFFGLIVAFSVFVGIKSSQQQAPQEDLVLKTYAIPGSGVSLGYPKDWTVSEDEDGVAFVSPSFSEFDVRVPFVLLTERNTNVEEVVATMKDNKQYDSDYPVSVESEKLLMINGTPAVELVLKQEPKNGDDVGIFRSVIFYREPNVYSLTSLLSPKDWEVYGPIFEKVYNSIELSTP